jgi:hypothetical protein
MQLELTETILMDVHTGAMELFIALQGSGFRTCVKLVAGADQKCRDV